MKICKDCNHLCSQTAKICDLCGSQNLNIMQPLHTVNDVLPGRHIIKLQETKNTPSGIFEEVKGEWQITGQLGFGGFSHLVEVQREGVCRVLKIPCSLARVITGCNHEASVSRESPERIARESEGLKNIGFDYFIRAVPCVAIYGKESFPVILEERAEGSLYELLQALRKNKVAREDEHWRKFVGGNWGLHPFDRLTAISHLAQALSHLHKNGFLHRDVKPQNVMVVDRSATAGVVFALADFGNIKRATDPRSTQIVATADYLDPMWLRRAGKEDWNVWEDKTQIDVYGLGLCATELILGVESWRDALNLNPDDIPDPGILNFERDYLTRLVTNDRWRDLIAKATTLDLDRRFRNAQEFYREFQKSTSQKTIRLSLWLRLKLPLAEKVNGQYLIRVEEFSTLLPLPGQETKQLPVGTVPNKNITPLGSPIHLPAEITEQLVNFPHGAWKIEGPDFCSFRKVDNSFLLEARPQEVRAALAPLLEIEPDLSGHLDFTGEIIGEAYV